MYYYLRDRYHNYQTWYKNNKSNFLLCHRNIFTLRKLWATCPRSESNNLKENIHSNRRKLNLVLFSSVQSVVFDSATPWTAACQASITDSQSLPKLMFIESVTPSNHLVLCHLLLLLPLIFSSIRVFSNESALCIRWPKNWRFSFSISPSSEYSELISFNPG